MLPIAERELRVASRRRGTYWVRFLSAALAMAMAATILLAMARERPVEQAHALFLGLAGLAFAFCLLSGVLTTCDCISEEKREGTLGLLFLTTLRGHDVVIGKMVASSLRAVSGLIALLPVMAMPLLMGSIDPAVVGKVALCLGNTLFLCLSLGVLVSVVARDPRGAVGGGLLALAFVLVLMPVLRWMFIEYILVDALHWYQPAPGQPEPLQWVLLCNPAMLLWWAVGGIFTGLASRPEFVQALAVQHALAWLLLGAACALVPRVWRDRVDAGSGRGRADSPGRDAGVHGAAARARHLEPTPFSWMIARERRPIWHTWAGLAVIAGVWLWGYIETREEWLQPAVALSALGLAGAWLKLRMAGMACRHFHEQRKSGALELLLCTPQTPSTLIRGHLSGLRSAIVWPLAATLLGASLLLASTASNDRSPADLPDLLVLFLVTVAILLLDLWTLAWWGMWAGMRHARYVRAVAATVGWILVLPGVLYLGGNVVLAVLGEMFDFAVAYDPGFHEVVLAWLAVAGTIDVLLLLRARSGLSSRFRALALENYGTRVQGSDTPRPGKSAASALPTGR
jgi:ABC-type transport system involved in cytochrome c biogenesis permease component